MGGVEEMQAGPLVRRAIAWSAAERVKPGEAASGDRYVVVARPGCAWIAVIDGLGHGAEAAWAAGQAAGGVEGHTEQSLEALARRCHEALRSTRGAVIGFAAFREGADDMEWLGIGNIQGVVHTSRGSAYVPSRTLLARSGIVGYTLPPMLVSRVPLTPNDLIVLATDGIRTDFADCLTRGAPGRELADHILSEYGRDSDDALVLVIRYLGREQHER